MIAYLAGKVISVVDNQIILKIPSGVGYLIHTHGEFLVNENLELFVWQKEDQLYGFTTLLERNWAESLSTLGVDNPTACQMIWQMGQQKISQALIYGNIDFFESFGIDKKTTTKIFKVFGSTTDKIDQIAERTTKKPLIKANKEPNKPAQKTESSFWAKVEDKNLGKTSSSKKVASFTDNYQSQHSWERESSRTKNGQPNWQELNHWTGGTQSQSGVLSVDFTQKMTDLGHSRGDIVSSITMLKAQNSWDNNTLNSLVEKAEKLLKSAKMKNEKLV